MIFSKASRKKKVFDFNSMPTEIVNEFNNLSSDKKTALNRMLEFENSSDNGFHLRKKNHSDLYKFDHSLNVLASKILSLHYPASELADNSPIFGKLSDTSTEVKNLKQHGYITSKYKLPEKALDSVMRSLENFQYSSRGEKSTVMSGLELQSISKSNKRLDGSGTTFWLTDQNLATHDPVISKLAFDPYILSIVSGYLGCEPIHVQTNIWFSFSTTENSAGLSKNAQLFHQDKDFIKFLKVFIYLNDVDENNGPHCYIEGSHKEDELFKKGVPLSTRVTDEDITKYYSSDQIKTATGPAGTIIFGDTCSTHKGTPVKKGSRLLLQLEYASSLYMRPYKPFRSVTPSMKDSLKNQGLSDRLTQNYDTSAQKDYIKTFNSTSYKFKNLASRVKNKLIANNLVKTYLASK